MDLKDLKACDLNEDALTEIFSNLSVKQRISNECVSKTWRRLSLVGVNKLKFLVDDKCNNVSEHLEDKWTLKVFHSDQILKTISKCKSIESVTFIKWNLEFKNLEHCKQIGEHFTTLKTLKFVDSHICDENFNSLIKNASYINKISFDCCSNISINVFDTIFEQCTELKSLIVNNSGEITKRCFQQMTQQLETLQYSHYKRFTFSPSTENQCEDVCSQLLFKNGESLRKLIVPQLNYSSFQILCNLKTLEYLKLNIKFNLDSWWKSIAWSNLRTLYLYSSECYMNDCGFFSLIKSCANLKVFGLHWLSVGKLMITDDSLKLLCETCSQLQVLIISEASEITDKIFIFLLKLKCLKILQLQNCEYLTDDGLASFVNSAKSLQTLGIKNNNCFHKTVDAMRQKASLNNKNDYYLFCHFGTELNNRHKSNNGNFHLFFHCKDAYRATTTEIKNSLKCLQFFSYQNNCFQWSR